MTRLTPISLIPGAGALPGSHLLPSVRGELLMRVGRSEREREVLRRKITEIGDHARMDMRNE